MNHGICQLCTLLLCLLVIGCTDAGDQSPAGADHGHGHDHDHSAESHLPFDSLVTRICHHRDAIKAAFDEGNREEAHDPLHEIGHLIGQLPDSAAETDLAESDWNQVKQASDNLMSAFGKVDEIFHGNEEGLEYSDIQQEVEESIAVLKDKAAMVANNHQERHP